MGYVKAVVIQVGFGGFRLRRLGSRSALPLGLVVCGVFLALCLLASVRFGAGRIGTWDVLSAFTAYGGSEDDLIVRTLRVPRALVAALVGASLAVSGAIIQGLTRNPLADPGILGIEAGAAFAVVVSVFLIGTSSLTTYALFAFVGAAVAAVVVYSLGTLGGGMNPMTLVVAGAAVAALLGSLTTAVLILDQRTLEEIRFWLAGSVAGRDLDLLLQALPYPSLGLLLAFALGRQITALTLGEDIATGLGQRTVWTKGLGVVAVVLLSGGAVAVAGPIGLVVPHVARFFVGVDYRWILPYSALLGAVLLVAAEIAARLVLRPQELPVGIMTALVGAPFFVYLARERMKG